MSETDCRSPAITTEPPPLGGVKLVMFVADEELASVTSAMLVVVPDPTDRFGFSATGAAAGVGVGEGGRRG